MEGVGRARRACRRHATRRSAPARGARSTRLRIPRCIRRWSWLWRETVGPVQANDNASLSRTGRTRRGGRTCRPRLTIGGCTPLPPPVRKSVVLKSRDRRRPAARRSDTTRSGGTAAGLSTRRPVGRTTVTGLGVGQLPRVGGGLQDCPVGRPRATTGHSARPGGAIVAPGRARREVVLDEGGRRRGDGWDATAVPSPPVAVSSSPAAGRAPTTSNNSSASAIAPIENCTAAALGLPAPSYAAPAAMSTVAIPEAAGA